MTLFDEMPQWGPNIGTLDIGGGSGTARHTNIVSPLEAIKIKARQTGARVQYITDNAVLAANDFRSIYPTPEVCLVFLKTYAGEAMDRTSFENDWNSTLVVNNVAALCPSTIGITHSAGVNTMPWANHPNVTAILAAHYPGEESGNAIVDILWGSTHPSGRLPYTIPKSAEDYDIPIVYPTDENRFDGLQADFTEGQLIDYRHFDKHGIEPLYEFGFGLGYAEFSISALMTIEKLSREPYTALPDPESPLAPGGSLALWQPLYYITATVKNHSNLKGATVAQLYISLPKESAGEETPVKVLRGFEKMWLEAEEERDIIFALLRRDLSFWDAEVQQWRIPKGEIKISLGLSSRDIWAEAFFEVL
jgi:beta-glucosidase